MNSKTDSSAMSAAFAAKTVPELTARYDDWAATYDAENAASGFRLPYLTAAFLARHVAPQEAPILDAGCGTGLGGDSLHVLGYRDLEQFVVALNRVI